VSDAAGIEVAGVTKRFGALVALNAVSFNVQVGTTLALLGPNGAGKTTLLKIVSGLSKASSGTVRVGMADLSESEDSVRRQFGVVSHQTMLYEDLTAAENLVFYGKLYGLDNLELRVQDTLGSVGLGDRSGDRVRTFSRGMKQRLAIARAVIHDPKVLLFDEPFTGLDVAGRDLLTERIRAFRAEGRTGILVTHDLGQAVDLADRYVMLDRGRVVREGDCEGVTVEELEGLYHAE